MLNEHRCGDIRGRGQWSMDIFELVLFLAFCSVSRCLFIAFSLLEGELHAPNATAYLDYPILNSSAPCGTDLLSVLGADHIFCQS